MKTAFLPLVAGLFMAMVSQGSAALTILVNGFNNTYYLTGSATGTPFVSVPGSGQSSLSWSNGGVTGGGSELLLGPSAFSAAGDLPVTMSLLIHANGNIGGTSTFATEGPVTLVANPGAVFSTASWAPIIQFTLGLTATGQNGETSVVLGDQVFKINYMTIPEPASASLAAFGAAGFLMRRRRAASIG